MPCPWSLRAATSEKVHQLAAADDAAASAIPVTVAERGTLPPTPWPVAIWSSRVASFPTDGGASRSCRVEMPRARRGDLAKRSLAMEAHRRAVEQDGHRFSWSLSHPVDFVGLSL